MKGQSHPPGASCFVVAAGLLVGFTFTAVGCGESSDEPSPPPPEASKPDEPGPSDFAFAPTVQEHAPEGLEMRLLAEVGNASEATLHVVVATYDEARSPRTRIELWTFDQRDKTELEPAESPTWLLSLTPDVQPPHEEARSRLRRALSLPNSIQTRPSGVSATSTQDALRTLFEAMQALGDPSVDGPRKLDAAARLFRGLDDDVLLDEAALSRLLHVLDEPSAAPRIDASTSPRRATATLERGEERIQVEMLRRTDGWVIARVRPQSE